MVKYSILLDKRKIKASTNLHLFSNNIKAKKYILNKTNASTTSLIFMRHAVAILGFVTLAFRVLRLRARVS